MTAFDLLSTVEYGGCSAKLPATQLREALADLPSTENQNLLVKCDTHDDAGVLKISENLALIQTTDFFPPVCSDPYEFGQIAAANALSDVYAMGGKVLSVLNIVAFPAHVPLDVLHEILRGGADKVIEAGGLMMGGHTIVDDIPKYGLAVTGTVHPKRVITNAAAKPGDVLVLTKPLGAGIVMAGKRIGEINSDTYQIVLNSMKQLNAGGAEVMQKYDVKCATDITGFGLAGHALQLAKASQVSLKIFPDNIPQFEGVLELLQLGCIPGACFRNFEYVVEECAIADNVSYEQKMLLMDAQTSGGILMCCPPIHVDDILNDLHLHGFVHSVVIGNVEEIKEKAVLIG